MSRGAPEQDWYAHFRKREGARTFALALLLSGLFHLSMVTVFRIVTYIPREDIRFARFTIVSVPAQTPGAIAAAPAIDTPGAPPQLALRGLNPDAAGGPLELPTLEFAELGRLRVREDSLPEPDRPQNPFREPSDDSWARFSRSLSNMSRNLTQLRLSGADPGLTPAPPALVPAPLPASRPAEGFEAYIVWATEPKDRKLLFAPPIEALWEVDPSEFPGPIEMVLQVNPLGRVVDVFNPNVIGGLGDAIQITALEYRFEPLDIAEGGNQKATLRVQRETARDRP